MTKDTITFTKAEIGYLLDLVLTNIGDEIYYGNREQFVKRQNKVHHKLLTSYTKMECIKQEKY